MSQFIQDLVPSLQRGQRAYVANAAMAQCHINNTTFMLDLTALQELLPENTQSDVAIGSFVYHEGNLVDLSLVIVIAYSADELNESLKSRAEEIKGVYPDIKELVVLDAIQTTKELQPFVVNGMVQNISNPDHLCGNLTIIDEAVQG